MTASPFNWKPLAGRTLEAALNRALALDPATLDALRPLDGQRVTVAVERPQLALQVTVVGDRLVVGTGREEAAAREIDVGHNRAMRRELRQIGPHAAADFEHLFA